MPVLPRVFDKCRASLFVKPSVVFYYRSLDDLDAAASPLRDMATKAASEGYPDDRHVSMLMFPSLWVEFSDGWAVHSVTDSPQVDCDGQTHWFDIAAATWLTMYGKNRKVLIVPFRMNEAMQDDPEPDFPVDKETRVMRDLCTRVFMHASYDAWCATEQRADPSAPVGLRMKGARAYEKAEDCVRYARLHDLRSLAGLAHNAPQAAPDLQEPADPDGSGIRKRDHAVRGHWRTYRNGARVWVQAHRRGDPELGSVTRVIRA